MQLTFEETKYFMKKIKAFISYTWDSPEHKEWVLNLANRLVENGIDIILDQYDLSVGNEMTYFMEKGMTADKIVAIMTPTYKKKADNRDGGAGYEYSLITKELFDSKPDQTRIIPVLRAGERKESSPFFMQTKISHDMRKNEKFDSRLFELIKILADQPPVIKPPLGKLPDFEDKIPDVEKTISDFQQKESFLKNKNRIIQSEKGVKLFEDSVNTIVEQISDTLENYKSNFGLHFHIKKDHRLTSILFSTVNYTFYFSSEGIYTNSAQDAKLILNFFRGPVGLDQGIDYDGQQEVIYRSKYKFDLDKEMNPIFTKIDNKNISLQTKEISTIAVREVVVNEIKLREDKLD